MQLVQPAGVGERRASGSGCEVGCASGRPPSQAAASAGQQMRRDRCELGGRQRRSWCRPPGSPQRARRERAQAGHARVAISSRARRAAAVVSASPREPSRKIAPVVARRMTAIARAGSRRTLTQLASSVSAASRRATVSWIPGRPGDVWRAEDRADGQRRVLGRARGELRDLVVDGLLASPWSKRDRLDVWMHEPVAVQHGIFVGEVCRPGPQERGDERALAAEARAGHDNCAAVHRDDAGVDEDVFGCVLRDMQSNGRGERVDDRLERGVPASRGAIAIQRRAMEPTLEQRPACGGLGDRDRGARWQCPPRGKQCRRLIRLDDEARSERSGDEAREHRFLPTVRECLQRCFDRGRADSGFAGGPALDIEDHRTWSRGDPERVPTAAILDDDERDLRTESLSPPGQLGAQRVARTAARFQEQGRDDLTRAKCCARKLSWRPPGPLAPHERDSADTREGAGDHPRGRRYQEERDGDEPAVAQ